MLIHPCQQCKIPSFCILFYFLYFDTNRYLHGYAIDVAMDVIRARDVRSLRLNPSDPEFRRLQQYFKKVLITRPRVPKQETKKKKVTGIVAQAGYYEFDC